MINYLGSPSLSWSLLRQWSETCGCIFQLGTFSLGFHVFIFLFLFLEKNVVFPICPDALVLTRIHSIMRMLSLALAMTCLCKALVFELMIFSNLRLNLLYRCQLRLPMGIFSSSPMKICTSASYNHLDNALWQSSLKLLPWSCLLML